ncbi:MAG: indole-3-glycerol-phosphate synthase [Myxococcales bacterium]
MTDLLTPILERKRRENARRRAHLTRRDVYAAHEGAPPRAQRAEEALSRRGAALPRVIAEIKMRSPSAGEIRPRIPGAVADIARQYRDGGASAISVLCDGPGFGGGALDLRRARQAVDLPLLFKEFVLDPVQIRLARAVGADMVLLLVRAVSTDALQALVDAVSEAGMAPVVEAADEAEVELALSTGARIIGVNARDLGSFEVDPGRARRAIELIPVDRVAVLMSGIRSVDALREVADSRADAVLVGEGLMRADDPGARLARWLSGPS